MKKISKFKIENLDLYRSFISYKEGQPTSKDLTPQQCQQLADNSLELSNAIKSEFGLEIFQEFCTDGSWINHYPQNSHNEIHCHDGILWQEKCNYIGILILNTGDDEEFIVFNENNSQANFYNITSGDCFIICNDVLHGLSKVKNNVTALMFPLVLIDPTPT